MKSKYAGKGRKTRKPTATRKGPSTKQLATRVKKLEHSEELKYDDFSANASSYGNVSTVYILSNPGQGDNYNERVGEEITSKYVNLKFRLGKIPSTDSIQYRCLLFWDVQTNGVGPIVLASTDLGQGLIDDTNITNVLYSPLNYRAKMRYHVLMDKNYVLNCDSSSTTKDQVIKKSFQLGGAKIKFKDSSTSISSIVSRCLCLIVISGSSTNVDNCSNLLTARFWYTDA